MDYRAPRYFETVTETGGIRAASERLCVAPSAVSRQIKRLEETLGIELLERNTRGVLTTEAGNRLLEHIRTLHREENTLFASISELKNLESGLIRIALGGGYSVDLISSAIKRFVEDYPGIRFELKMGGSDQIVSRIHNDEADIGLVFNPSFDPMIESINVCCQPLYLITRVDDSRFSSHYRVTLQDVATDRFVLMNPEFGVRQLLMKCQADLGIDLPVHLECDSFEVVKVYVQEGLGVSVLPRFCVIGEIRRGSIRAVPLDHELLNSMNSHVIVRKGRHLPKSVAAFAQLLVREMAACH